MLLKPVPLIYRKRHNTSRRVARNPGPGALTLVACAYDPGTFVELTFSRAIDISDVDGNAFTVIDGTIMGFRYVANGGTSLISPTTVQLLLVGEEEITADDVTMTATSGNGIVAAGDGAAWAGCEGVEIPFPS